MQLVFALPFCIGWTWLRIALYGPGRLRLNHFGRRIREGFKNSFSFHRWRSGCHGKPVSLPRHSWRDWLIFSGGRFHRKSTSARICAQRMRRSIVNGYTDAYATVGESDFVMLVANAKAGGSVTLPASKPVSTA